MITDVFISDTVVSVKIWPAKKEGSPFVLAVRHRASTTCEWRLALIDWSQSHFSSAADARSCAKALHLAANAADALNQLEDPTKFDHAAFLTTVVLPKPV